MPVAAVPCIDVEPCSTFRPSRRQGILDNLLQHVPLQENCAQSFGVEHELTALVPAVGRGDGGASWARIASLVERCKLNGADPCVYLRDTLEPIAAGHSQSCPDELLPWAFIPLRQRV